jgi:hypothetical protein
MTFTLRLETIPLRRKQSPRRHHSEVNISLSHMEHPNVNASAAGRVKGRWVALAVYGR